MSGKEKDLGVDNVHKLSVEFYFLRTMSETNCLLPNIRNTFVLKGKEIPSKLMIQCTLARLEYANQVWARLLQKHNRTDREENQSRYQD